MSLLASVLGMYGMFHVSLVAFVCRTYHRLWPVHSLGMCETLAWSGRIWGAL